MRSFAPLRLTAQLCFFAAVFCFFPILRPCWPVFALLALLSFAAAMLAVHVSRPALRLALGLLPALALVLVSDALGLAAVCLTTVYTAAVLAMGRFSMKQWQYRREARLLLLLCFLVELLSLLFITRNRFSIPGLCFAGASVLTILLALRVLWLGTSVSPAWEAGTSGLLFLPMAGGAALGAGLWALFPLLKAPVIGLGALIGGLINLITDFFNWLLRDAANMYDEVFSSETLPELTEDTRILEHPDATLPVGRPPSKSAISIPWEVLLFVAVALVLLFLVIWLFRRAEAPAAATAPDRFQTEKDRAEPRRPRGRRRRRTSVSNRNRVRAIYQEYLVFLRRNGIRPGLSSTTADISGKAADILTKNDVQLRTLYRRARYSDAELTPADVAAAEAALAELLRDEDQRRSQQTAP